MDHTREAADERHTESERHLQLGRWVPGRSSLRAGCVGSLADLGRHPNLVNQTLGALSRRESQPRPKVGQVNTAFVFRAESTMTSEASLTAEQLSSLKRPAEHRSWPDSAWTGSDGLPQADEFGRGEMPTRCSRWKDTGNPMRTFRGAASAEVGQVESVEATTLAWRRRGAYRNVEVHIAVTMSAYRWVVDLPFRAVSVADKAGDGE